MRRILLVLAAALVMAAMMAVMASVAFAKPDVERCPSGTHPTGRPTMAGPDHGQPDTIFFFPCV